MTNTNTIFTVPEGACPTYNPNDPLYTPFANLEVAKLRSACSASRAAQVAYYNKANFAYAICLWYWASVTDEYSVLDETCGPITKEEAIALLMRYCHRSRAVAIFNIEHSRFADAMNRRFSEYSQEVVKILNDFALLSVICDEED